MDVLIDVGLVLITGMGFLVALFFLLIAGVLVVKIGAVGERWLDLQSKRVRLRLNELESSPLLLAFGRTTIGQTMNAYLERGKSYVDEADDPFIQRIFQLPILRQAANAGWLTPEEFAAKASDIFAEALKLTDGVPDVDVTVLPLPTPSDKEPAG